MSPCFLLAVATKLKPPQRTVWWWAVAPGSQVFVPSWTLLWEMRLQLLRRKRKVWEASLSGNTVRALEQTMPGSFQGWHRLLHVHLKGWGREKHSLWLVYLYWTKPLFWALWLFEWFSHNHRVLMKFILLTPFTKQTVYGLGQLGSPNCTSKCERRKRGVKTSWLVDSAGHSWDKGDEVWVSFWVGSVLALLFQVNWNEIFTELLLLESLADIQFWMESCLATCRSILPHRVPWPRLFHSSCSWPCWADSQAEGGGHPSLDIFL